jgi:Zn-dependent protease with chaperone function
VLFFDEQRRNRRASWRFSAFAVVAVLLSGLPLCLLLSPLLIALTVVIAHVIDVIVPIPLNVWTSLERIARAVPHAWRMLRGDESAAPVPWALVTAVLVVPGAALMLGAWLWIRSLFRHAGAGGALRRFGARPPRRDVVEELQIINIIEELAVAAGVPPLQVMLIDSPAVNAVAVGRTVDDATILVSRGLLDIDRDARQAILAHIVGSVGNGDLKIASILLSVFQTWGLVALLLDAPFGPRARRAIGLFVMASRNAWRSQGDRLAAAYMLDRLMDGAGLTFDDLTEHTTATERSGTPWHGLFVDVPLYLTMGIGSIAAKAAIATFTLLGLGPWVARMWRARRRLADATAVQLTRNPDALARAVREMESRNVAVEGGEPVSFLFPFWTRWSSDAPPRDDVTGYVVGMHLELDQRLASLQALGALPTGGVKSSGGQTTPKELPEFISWASLAIGLVAVCVAFNLIATSMLIWGVWSLLHLVLGAGAAR